MEPRINIITLGVSDLSESSAFYENKFGWQRSDMSNENIIFYELRGMLLALYSHNELAKDASVDPESYGFKGFTLAYNAISEEEVDQLIYNLKSKGVSIIKKPQKAFWGGYSGYISDPDGNLWEIAYNPYLNID